MASARPLRMQLQPPGGSKSRVRRRVSLPPRWHLDGAFDRPPEPIEQDANAAPTRCSDGVDNCLGMAGAVLRTGVSMRVPRGAVRAARSVVASAGVAMVLGGVAWLAAAAAERPSTL